jgi:hypothetical protein
MPLPPTDVTCTRCQIPHPMSTLRSEVRVQKDGFVWVGDEDYSVRPGTRRRWGSGLVLLERDAGGPPALRSEAVR